MAAELIIKNGTERYVITCDKIKSEMRLAQQKKESSRNTGYTGGNLRVIKLVDCEMNSKDISEERIAQIMQAITTLGGITSVEANGLGSIIDEKKHSGALLSIYTCARTADITSLIMEFNIEFINKEVV